MKTRYIIGFIGVLALLYSCVDDKGSYEYVKTPSVRITFDEYLYDGVIGEETRIEPNLFFGEGDDASNYKFEWQLNGKVVGTEQVLSYVPEEAITYYVLYSVIDKATQIRVMRNLQLGVSSPYKTGWAILSAQNNKALLSQVRDGASYVNYLDVYGNVNGGESLGAQPYKLVEHYSGRKTNPEILVINRDAKGPLELEGNGMTKVLYTTQEFTGGLPSHFEIADVAYLYYTDVMLMTDGQIYTRWLQKPDDAGFHSAPYSNVPVYFSKGMKITKLAHSTFYKSKHLIMYDEKNHRLLCLGSAYSYNTGEILEVPVTGLEGKTLVSIDVYPSSTSEDWVSKYMLLLKDANGMYTVKTFKVKYGLGTVKVTDNEDFAFSGSEYLTAKSKFFCSKDISGKRLFFTGGASNNEIFYFEKATRKTVLYATCSSEITDIQLNKGSTTLGVGMKNGFVVYDVRENVITSGQPKVLHQLDGIGEVVDIIYRYGSPSTMYR